MINRSMIMMALTAIAGVALPAGASAAPHHGHRQDELDMFANTKNVHQKATPLQEKEHHLSRKIDREHHTDYLERQNEMLLERLQSAEQRLTTAERDINSLRMDYANLDARFSACEDAKGDNILDDMVALKTANSNDSDVVDKLIGLDMTLSNDMMSIK